VLSLSALPRAILAIRNPVHCAHPPSICLTRSRHSLYIGGQLLFSPSSPWGRGDECVGFVGFHGLANGSRQAHFLLADFNRFPGCVLNGFTASAFRTRGVNPNTKEEL
jgi:hypothetical protein